MNKQTSKDYYEWYLACCEDDDKPPRGVCAEWGINHERKRCADLCERRAKMHKDSILQFEAESCAKAIEEGE